jgi:hypothetical protein
MILRVQITGLLFCIVYLASGQLPDHDRIYMDSVTSDMCKCYFKMMDAFDEEAKKLVMADLAGAPEAKSNLQRHLQSLDSLQRKKFITAVKENILSENSTLNLCVAEMKAKYDLNPSENKELQAERNRYLVEKIGQSGDCKYLLHLMMRGKSIKK